MIHLKTKSKARQKPKKRNRAKVSSRVPRRPSGYFALTPGDVAEINMLSDAVTEMNMKALEQRRVKDKNKA